MFPAPTRELRYTATDIVVTEEEYKAQYPHTSFAIDWEPEDAEWVECIPPVTGPFKESVRDGVEQVDGKWRAKWNVAQLVPTHVPMLNARLALIAAGHMTAVKAFVDDMPGTDGEQARAYLEYAQNVRRDHWLVGGIQQVLGLTAADIDTLFITAATID